MTRRQLTGTDPALDAGGDFLCAPSTDPILS